VDDRLFCSTYQGAYEISIEDDSLHLIKAFNKDLEVTSIMKDHESNYWCSTLGDGLLKFSNLDYELLNNKDTYGILVKDNTIYTGMGSTEYLIYENGTINYGKLQPKNSFVNQKIRDLKFLNGALWFEVDGGIARVEKGQTYYYRTGVGEIVEYMGKPVIGNKTGCYILDSWKQFDELHPNVKPRKLMYDLVKPIISKRIFSLEVVQEDLWVGTRKGLVIVHDNKKDRELFKDLHVKQIVSHKNEVVVAFESSPVILINGSDTTDLSATYHLPESGYNDIFFNSNYFLFSSATGLFQINRNSGEVITTLNNVNIKETEIYHDSLYISSENGLYRSKFPLENITKYSIPVELVSTQVNLKHVGTEIPVKLSYDENNLSMEFRAISYSEYPLSYYYQLNDQEWEPFEGKLTLKALTDGNYDLNVKVETNGTTSEIKNYSFTILKPWWRTWWFGLSLFGVLVLLVYWFFKVRILTYNRDIVRELLQLILDQFKKDKYIIVKDVRDGSNTKILLNKTLYIESSKNYVTLFMDDKKVVVRSTLKEIHQKLNDSDPVFIRCHRSYIINFKKIEAVHGEFLKVKEEKIPIGSSYFNTINSKMELLNIKKRP